MIVTCERCATQFQLDDARVPSDGVRVRCSRCKHAFLVEPPARTEAEKIHRVARRALEEDSPPDPSEDLAASSLISNEPSDDEEESDWEFNDDQPAVAASEPVSAADPRGTAESAVDDLLGGAAPFDPAPPETDPEPSDPANLFGDALDEDRDAPPPETASADPSPVAAETYGAVDLDVGPADALDVGLADDLGGAAAEALPLAVQEDSDGVAALAEAAPEEGDELGSPDEWDIFEESIESDVPAPSTPRHSVPAQPAARADPMFDDPEPRGVWLRRAAETVGWLATGALCVVGLVSGLQPDVAGRRAPAAAAVGGMTFEAVDGHWLDNATHGPIYVISGQVRNAGPQLRARVPLVLELRDASGRPLGTPAIPLGPVVAQRILRESDLDAIRAAQREQLAFEASTLHPNEVRTFQAIAGALPKAAESFAFRTGGDAGVTP